MAAYVDQIVHGRQEGRGLGVWDEEEADPANGRPAVLGGNEDLGFPYGPPAADARLDPADERLVNLHGSTELGPAINHHETTHAMAPLPGRMEAAEVHGALEGQRTDADFRLTDLPGDIEPGLQWMSRSVKDGARGHGVDPAALFALAGGHGSPPKLGAGTARTGPPCTPAKLGQKGGAFGPR